jgi:CRP-like cAMP-binding protein
MDDPALVRLGRELFMAALGLSIDDLDSWVMDRMIALLEEQSVGAGQIIYRAGEPADFLYFVREGRLSREGAPSWVMQGHWVVGGLEAIAELPHPRTATALVDFSMMRVPVDGWLELLEDSFPAARAAMTNAARAVALLEERIPDLPRLDGQAPEAFHVEGAAPLSLVERLALLVEIRMLRRAGVQTLGDLAGMSRESVFEAGATVLERGVERSELLLVIDGDVIATRENPDVVRHYGPGDLVCGAAAFGTRAPFWEAKAAAPTRVLSFPVDVWFDLMADHFDLVRSTFEALMVRRELLLEHLAAGQEELVLT